MSTFLCTHAALRPPRRLPPMEDSSTAGWARRVPLRPARLLFPDGSDGKDPDAVPHPRPVAHMRTWRGRILGWPSGDLVPVVIAEVPSGRTVETDLSIDLFKSANLPAEPDQLFVFRWWQAWTGTDWEPVQVVASR